ncbi:apolipoprotein N-acyltransferase [Pelagibius litoralis]|uniref:Apolipoprotein N-acyltransferase n=1 Tax=Pelagibius litoralis TaxID=374515 RepID=A0A967F3E3_9PROT|nr:apolipoprotein N-acyltransferase [Pelagibius litoralis]NIA72160.1 apolipoprotein N-acyltransferase [Pelagibius litoralis]
MTADTGGREGWRQGWARRLAALTGWRRLALAAFCGGLAALALPPLYLFPLLVPAFAVVFCQLGGARNGRQAALIGWAFGSGHFAVGLYWVGIAFLVDAERFAWAMPFAISGLAAGLALFPALAFWLTFWVAAKSRLTGPARVVAFAAAWLVSEGLRGWVLTGFPWNLIGSVWAFSAETMQLSSLGGVWLLSLITVIAATAPAILAQPALRPGRAYAFVCLALLLPAGSWGYGAWRLAEAPAVGTAVVEEVRLRLVQPSIPQKLKWRRDLRAGHLRQQVRMSLAPGHEDRTHIIWAETAIPYVLSMEPVLQRELAAIVPPGGYLIAGALRVLPEQPDGPIWNSLYALGSDGKIAATFDKAHLVPFGEYVPLRALLGFTKLTAGSRDFTPGPGLQTLKLPGLPAFSPLICYEVIFPGRVKSASAEAPRWLLNVTNDAWFGDSSGPYQHFASARLRAIEEGLPLIRVANNGISAVIDSYGRVIDQINLNDRGIIDAELPEAAEAKTLYSNAGNWLYLVELIICTCVIFVLRRFA